MSIVMTILEYFIAHPAVIPAVVYLVYVALTRNWAALPAAVAGLLTAAGLSKQVQMAHQAAQQALLRK
jgi:hypothetical protein